MEFDLLWTHDIITLYSAGEMVIIVSNLGSLFNLKKYRFPGIHARFFLAITVLMFIAILSVGLLSYRISYSALMDQISNEKIKTLSQTRNTADVTLKEIEKAFIAESINPQLLSYMENPFDDEYKLLRHMIRDLVKIMNSNNYIFSVYIYLPEHDMIVTTEDGLWKTGDFYDLSWLEHVGKTGSGSWSTTRDITTYAGERLGVITFVTSIPFDEHINTNQRLLVVNVYEKELLKLLEAQDSSDLAISFIIDAEGKVVAHKDKSLLGQVSNYKDTVINNILSIKSGSFRFRSPEGRYLASHVKSDYTRWNYVSLIPEKHIIRPIQNLRTINMVIALLCMFFGLIAAYIISSRIYKPISRTILSAKRHILETGTLIKDTDEKDEMKFINATIEQIADKNKNLNKVVQKNEAVLREGLMLDLLLSATIDELQLASKLKQLNMSFPHKNLYVLVFLIDKYNTFFKECSDKDRSVYTFAVRNVAEEILGRCSRSIMVQTDKDKFAAILNTDEGEEVVIKAANEIRESIREILKFSLTVGISESYNSINETSYSYNEALEFARSRISLGGDRVISRKDIEPGINQVFLISASREEQIFNNIKQGNIDEAVRNIEKVIQQIRKEPGYPPEEIHQFFYSILGFSIKAVNENGWSVSDIFGDNCNLYRDLVENDTANDIKDWISGILSRMSNFITEKKESKNFSLIDSILNYLNTNYNKDISLNAMADYVSLSTPYLSRLFKNETGENFLEYLTRLRIEKSKELLLDSDHNITTIAEKVNFGNAQNYIRIFKKYEGMTPGQYREANIKKNLNSQNGVE